MDEQDRLREACVNADWMQVVLNGGPPCFHLEGAKFCLRAERWDGHETFPGDDIGHSFVSLSDLMDAELRAAREKIAELESLIDWTPPLPSQMMERPK